MKLTVPVKYIIRVAIIIYVAHCEWVKLRGINSHLLNLIFFDTIEEFQQILF